MNNSQTNIRIFITGFIFCLIVSPINIEAQNSVPNNPRAINGKNAILKLGERLPDVAKRNGLSVAEFRKNLKNDKNLWIDETDQAFFVENSITESSKIESDNTSSILLESYSTEQAFNLNSKPGVSKIIYLDFGGHLIQDSAWNGFVGDDYYAPPFDVDGDPNTFNPTERTKIIEIWKRVSEDFAGFDVNVTTEYPGEDVLTRLSSSDQNFGTRALITKSNSGFCSSCGGIAYVGVFNRVGDYYKPALVFHDALLNNAKYIAEATSHEVGHNLGLYHHGASSTEYYKGHGSGETGWAPIMGVGYYQNLSQWSKGEYDDANNSSQDDLLRIQNYDLSYSKDDHGNDFSNATAIDQGSKFVINGVIEKSDDIDFFSINSGIGDITIFASPLNVGPNIDIEVNAYSKNGDLIASSNQLDTLSAGLSFKAESEGTYYISVRGVGKGNISTGYSDYGSLGIYKLDGEYNNETNNLAPVANIESDLTEGEAPLLVNFSAESSYDPDGEIVSYNWDFGDGNIESGINVQNTFDVEGSYTVRLTVIDELGLSSSSTITISASEAPNQEPVSIATSNITSGFAPLEIQFDASESYDPDGSISTYAWNFGDGNSSNQISPQHTYSDAGTFKAVLTVTDNSGAFSSDTIEINVESDSDQLIAPSNLSGETSGNSIIISWQDNSSNESGFNIYRGTESGKGRNRTITWEIAGVVSENHTSFEDSELSSGTYHYQVEAYNSNNQSISDSIKVNLKVDDDSNDSGGGGNNGKGGGNNKK